MPGYPCGCRRMPDCGECQGTAPEQYQLTVPSDVFYGSESLGGSCEDACEDFNGVYLLDYNPELTYITLSDVTCIWESPAFDACYLCAVEDPEIDPTETCYEVGWRWRVELSEEISSDGKVRAYVFLRSLAHGYSYMWIGEFEDNCSTSINLTWEPNFLSNPGTGCHVDQTKVLTLEVPS